MPSKTKYYIHTRTLRERLKPGSYPICYIGQGGVVKIVIPIFNKRKKKLQVRLILGNLQEFPTMGRQDLMVNA